MIFGYGQLAKELQGLYTVGSLRVLDCTNRLPMKRQWHEGCRVWDAEEVRQFKAVQMAKRAAISLPQIEEVIPNTGARA